MNSIRRFLHLPIPERHQLLEVVVLLVLVSCALRVFPFRRVSRSLTSLVTTGPLFGPADRLAPERIAWTVDEASARLPFVSSLTCALVLQALLQRSGHVANTCEDVSTSSDGWLQVRTRVSTASVPHAAQADHYQVQSR
jgi:hypothetical protein